MIRVGVIGAAGRMGATVCNAVVADPGLELVAVVDSGAPGSTTHGLTISGELRALADAQVDVAIDFTVAEASRVNLPWLAMHSIHAVVGTTGSGKSTTVASLLNALSDTEKYPSSRILVFDIHGE